MIRLFAIARNAFVEAVRQPIYGVLILITFAVLVLDLPLSGWTMGRGAAEYRETDQQMLINLGLSTLLVSGLLIAAFSASGVLSREIEEKTILMVVSKPVPRPLVVGGKFVGVAAAIVVAYYVCSLVFLMTVRHQVVSRVSDPIDYPVIVLGCSAVGAAVAAALFCNYFFGWNFASSAVWFGVILLTVAMAAVIFVGKGWTSVPPGYDVPPMPKPEVVLIEPESWQAMDVFFKRITDEGYEVRKIDRENGVVTLGFTRQLHRSPAGAVRDLKRFRGVRNAKPVLKPPPVITGRLLITIVLMLFAVLVFVAVAVAASTRLGQVMTLLVCFGFFLIGTITQYLFGRFADVSSAAKAAYLLWPNLPYFYALDALIAGKTIPASYVGLTAAYAACQIIAILAVGMALFQRRELAVQVESVGSVAPLSVSVLAWSGRAAAVWTAVVALTVMENQDTAKAIAAFAGVAETTWVIVAAGTALLAGLAVFGWLLWGWFGRGVKWTYYFVLVCAGLTMGLVAIMAFRSSADIPAQAMAAVIAAAIIAIILLLPRTRHHFAIFHKEQ